MAKVICLTGAYRYPIVQRGQRWISRQDHKEEWIISHIELPSEKDSVKIADRNGLVRMITIQSVLHPSWERRINERELRTYYVECYQYQDWCRRARENYKFK